MKLIDSIIRQPARISFSTGTTGGTTATVGLDAVRDAETVTIGADDGSFVVVPGASESLAGTLTAAGHAALRSLEAARHATRAAAEAAVIPPDRAVIRTDGYATPADGGGALYRRAGSEPAHAGKLQSADGAWWELAEVEVSPGHFGATETAADCTAEITAAFEMVRASWNPAKHEFDRILDFGGRRYNVTGSVDMTGLRQPGVIVRNGQIRASGAGNVVLDCTGTNQINLSGLSIDGDPDDPPAVGLLLAREASGAIAPNCLLVNVRITGSFTKAAMVNFASEVSRHVGARLSNDQPSDSAYAYVGVGDSQMLADHIGGLASAHTTLASGRHSNILHDLGSITIQRPSKSALPVNGISRTNPAVVTVNPAALAASHIANGVEVYFHDVAGMEELNFRTYTAANVDPGAGTLELQGVDARGYGAFAAGTLRMKSGPGMLLGDVKSLHARHGYVLTYGAPSIRMIASSGSIRDIVLGFQQEADPATVIEWETAASTTVFVRGFALDLLATAQSITDEVMKVNGSGQINIEDARIRVNHIAAAPANGLISGQSKVRLRNAEISVPYRSMLDDVAPFVDFSGTVYAGDDGQIRSYGVPKFVTGVAATAPAEVIADADGSGVGPFFDLIRNRATESANDVLGELRFKGKSAPYVTIRGRIDDPASSGRAGALEFVAFRDGTRTVAAKLNGPAVQNQTALAILVDAGGTVSLKRVQVGAADSGGSGMRQLVVTN